MLKSSRISSNEFHRVKKTAGKFQGNSFPSTKRETSLKERHAHRFTPCKIPRRQMKAARYFPPEGKTVSRRVSRRTRAFLAPTNDFFSSADLISTSDFSGVFLLAEPLGNCTFPRRVTTMSRPSFYTLERNRKEVDLASTLRQSLELRAACSDYASPFAE